MKISFLTLILVVLVVFPAQAEWKQWIDSDEMTGKVEAYTVSEKVKSTKPMAFPYDDTVAWLGFSCNPESESVFFGFSRKPNLTNRTLMKGYDRIATNLKWGDKIEYTVLINFGDKYLHFRYDDITVEKLLSSSKVLLPLEWHGSGTVYFKISLDGSAEAIKSARNVCEQQQ